MIHLGGCHCGNLRVSLQLTQPPREVRLWACGCSFCRRHNTRTASDPDGAVEIWADDWSRVQLYRSGTGTAEFIICNRCGVYIGAMGDTPSGKRAVINTTCLDDRALFTREPANRRRRTMTARRQKTVSRAAPWTGHRRRSIAEPASDHPVFHQDRQIAGRQAQFAAKHFRVVLADQRRAP